MVLLTNVGKEKKSLKRLGAGDESAAPPSTLKKWLNGKKKNGGKKRQKWKCTKYQMKKIDR